MILDALEGLSRSPRCASSASHCCIEQTCLVGRAWQRVNVAIRRSLQDITLLELAGLNGSGQPWPSPLDRGFPTAPHSTAGRSAKPEQL